MKCPEDEWYPPFQVGFSKGQWFVSDKIGKVLVACHTEETALWLVQCINAPIEAKNSKDFYTVKSMWGVFSKGNVLFFYTLDREQADKVANDFNKLRSKQAKNAKRP